MLDRRELAVVLQAIGFILIAMLGFVGLQNIRASNTLETIYIVLIVLNGFAAINYLITWLKYSKGEHHIVWAHKSKYGVVLVISEVIFVISIIYNIFMMKYH